MKKWMTLILIFAFVLALAGCQPSDPKDTETPEEAPQINPFVSQNKDIFVSLPLENSVAENHVRINGLTTLKELYVEVYDSSGNLLNENNINVELFIDDEILVHGDTIDLGMWKTFNKYLYFSKKPKTATGTVKIFSNKDNVVEIGIQFIRRLGEEEGIKVLSANVSDKQKDTIRVYGYASVYNGILEYEIKDQNGKVVADGQIQATSGKPDTGLFATDIPLNIDPQDATLILKETETFEGEEPAVIEVLIPYQK